MYDCIVVGGGPAGMMAAITASNRGKKVALIERNDQLGKKLLISGGGRCNITNNKNGSDFMRGISDRFLYKTLGLFGPYEVIRFFESRGVELVEEDNNRMFPKSGKAEDILKCLLAELKDVDIIHEHVIDVSREGYGYVIKTERKKHEAKAVILATGGKSYPKLGSTGDGFHFLEKLGHKMIPTYPMNTPMVSNDSFIQEKTLQGLTLPDVEIRYKKLKYRGGMLFTHFGISGPIVLNLSKHIHFGLKEYNKVHIDLIPDVKIEQLRNEYLRRDKEVLLQYLPKRLVEYLLATYGMKKNQSEISKKQFNQFFEAIKNFEVTIAGLKGYENAFITGGGVSLQDVNPATMESKVMFNLYIVGELLDVSGITGGYNHTIALSTGYSAGYHV